MREEQEQIATAILGAELRVYHALGHALHWENPVRIAADIVDFVTQRVLALPLTTAGWTG